MLNRLTIYIVILFLPAIVVAQNTKPQGSFIVDTTRIGEPIQFALSFHHPKTMEVFFPDSSYSFAPFEYISKEYFPTVTNNEESVDSVIYTLRTFEVKNSMELSLPVFVVEHGDTTRVFSPNDNVQIKSYFREMPDTLVFKTDVAYTEVPVRYNYPYYVAFFLIVILVVFILYFVLGKTIIRNYRLYIMYNKHVQYLRTFDRLHKEMKEFPNLTAMEKALGEWKNYLTRLEQKPINTFTTTEIISLFNKEELKESLQDVDRSIYSGSITGDPGRALTVLKKFSNKRYKKRRKELKNAR